ncbi:MAG: anthranilate phosphoribosyltransferase [archaeon]|jgi:anthranilate synthase/phosphoribosyltransferase
MKIVFIDNYDSFANTIAAYFANAGAEVVMYNSNCSIETIKKQKPDLILLGPGPNGPREAGNYLEVIDKFHKTTPIFGICLGFQAIMEYFGESVKPLAEVMHGQASEVEHDGKTIFRGIAPKQKFARYHSLGVLKVPECFELSAKAGNVVMSARHKTYQVEGVQFHPESILSMHNEGGEKLIENIINQCGKVRDNTTSNISFGKETLPINQTSNNLKEIIKKVIQKEELNEKDVEEIVTLIEQNTFIPTQLAGLLCALETKKITANELSLLVEKLIQKAQTVDLGKDCIDVCGTGGDGKNTFNISTATMFVIAGAGVKVAKHGNKAVSSSSGSFDALEALGINTANITINPKETMNKTGIAFLFAQKHHPLFKNVGPLRKELGVKTVFNLMGPLLNPAKTKKQLMGVFNPELTETIAEVMKKRGIERAMVVNGEGLDEITITGKTKITQLEKSKITTTYFDPKEFGFNYAKFSELEAKTKEESAQIILDILNGKKGAKRDIVVLNAAAALIVAGKAKDFKEGIKLAQESIDSGNALNTFEELKKTSQS